MVQFIRHFAVWAVLMSAGLATTWNPADKGPNIVLTGGDMNAAGAANVFNSVRATTSRTEGYFEVKFLSASPAASVVIGVGDAAFSLGGYPGSTAKSAGVQFINTQTPQPFVNGVTRANGFTNLPTSIAGDVVMVYVKEGNVWWGRNGVWTSGDPSTGTAPNVTGFTGAVFPAVAPYDYVNVVQLRTAAPFSYPVPTDGTPWDIAPPPSTFITVSEFHVNTGPARQFIGPIFVNSNTGNGPQAFVWTPLNLATIDPLAVQAKVAQLSGRLIITGGTTPEIADLGVVFRTPGDTSTTCDVPNFAAQAVYQSNPGASGGVRQNITIRVPFIAGEAEWCWFRSTTAAWPASASYGVNLNLDWWAK